MVWITLVWLVLHFEKALYDVQLSLVAISDAAEWHVEEALVYNDGTGETAYFQQSNWIARYPPSRDFCSAHLSVI